MQSLKQLVDGLSMQRFALYTRLDHVGFVGGKVALGQAFRRVRPFSPVIIIPPIPDTQSCIILFIDSDIKSQTLLKNLDGISVEAT